MASQQSAQQQQVAAHEENKAKTAAKPANHATSQQEPCRRSSRDRKPALPRGETPLPHFTTPSVASDLAYPAVRDVATQSQSHPRSRARSTVIQSGHIHSDETSSVALAPSQVRKRVRTSRVSAPVLASSTILNQEYPQGGGSKPAVCTSTAVNKLERTALDQAHEEDLLRGETSIEVLVPSAILDLDKEETQGQPPASCSEEQALLSSMVNKSDTKKKRATAKAKPKSEGKASSQLETGAASIAAVEDASLTIQPEPKTSSAKRKKNEKPESHQKPKPAAPKSVPKPKNTKQTNKSMGSQSQNPSASGKQVTEPQSAGKHTAGQSLTRQQPDEEESGDTQLAGKHISGKQLPALPYGGKQIGGKNLEKVAEHFMGGLKKMNEEREAAEQESRPAPASRPRIRLNVNHDADKDVDADDSVTETPIASRSNRRRKTRRQPSFNVDKREPSMLDGRPPRKAANQGPSTFAEIIAADATSKSPAQGVADHHQSPGNEGLFLEDATAGVGDDNQGETSFFDDAMEGVEQGNEDIDSINNDDPNHTQGSSGHQGYLAGKHDGVYDMLSNMYEGYRDQYSMEAALESHAAAHDDNSRDNAVRVLSDPDSDTEPNEARLTKTAMNILSSLNGSQGCQDASNGHQQNASRQQLNIDLTILAVAQLQRAKGDLDPGPFSKVRVNREMHETDKRGCSFCLFSCETGVSDSRVWLPKDAAAGYCDGCHSSTNTADEVLRDIMAARFPQLPPQPERMSPLEEYAIKEDLRGKSEQLSGRKIFGSAEHRKNLAFNEIHPTTRRVYSKSRPDEDITKYMGVQVCRDCPWRQLDCKKARICDECKKEKLDIIKHRHMTFEKVVESGSQVDEYGDSIRQHPRYRNCMICTNHAIFKCSGCPLRVCVNCEVLVKREGHCKGYLDLIFYHYKRDHIRNDAFLLRSDGGGF